MVKGLISAVKEIIYPAYCLACQKKIAFEAGQNPLCAYCRGSIIPNTPPFCAKCGRGRTPGEVSGTICAECRIARFYFDRAWSACRYQGVIREIIQAFKYKHKLKLSGLLTGLMADFIRDYRLPLAECDYTISVPLYPARLREREFNQSQILAAGISDYLKIENLNGVLRRLRNTPAQAELSCQKRQENIRGAFSVRDDDKDKLAGKHLLLIDDVLTTGSTASESARALKEAGAGSVLVLTIAS